MALELQICTQGLKSEDFVFLLNDLFPQAIYIRHVQVVSNYLQLQEPLWSQDYLHGETHLKVSISLSENKTVFVSTYSHLEYF